MRAKTMKSMNCVKPVLPVAPYIGGKRILSKTIIRHIETIPHQSYAEAFVGMGGVFLRRREKPKGEFINDYSRDVANLFRVLQNHYQAFLDMIRWQITTRAEFNRMCDMNPDTLTDLQRAARFLYLQRLAFGGKVSGKNFGVDNTGGARFNINRLEPMLEDVHTRLSGVVIECLDYKEFILRYDTKTTLFYLDPPYYGNEKDYGADMFTRDEFAVMADLLGGIKGQFILSLNDRPEVRKTFKSFYIQSEKTTYTIAGGDKAKQVGEVLISNVKLGRI
jgi:DNA adenine methylase